MWRGGDQSEAEKLACCYQNSLKFAVDNGCKTVAFPNISTGVYGYPKKEAAEIAVKTVSGLLSGNNKIEKVIFVCFDDENYFLMKQLQKKNR